MHLENPIRQIDLMSVCDFVSRKRTEIESSPRTEPNEEAERHRYSDHVYENLKF